MNRRRLVFIGFLALLLGAFVSTFVHRTLQEHLAPQSQTGRIQLIFRNPNDASQEKRASVQDLYVSNQRKLARVKYSPLPLPPTGYKIQPFPGDHRGIFKVQ